MTSTNDINHTHHPPNLYTIYTGSIPNGANVNYGFCSSHPQAPPPKYEDVMSGHYPYISETSIRPQPTSVNVNIDQHFDGSEINNFQRVQSEPYPQQVYKHKRSHVFGALFFALVLSGIFLLRGFI